MFTQEEINQGIQDLIKEQEEKKMTTNRLFAIAIAAVIIAGIVGLGGMLLIDESHSQDTALIHSQQQTIEAQETIIDVQKGLIGGLVLENNKYVSEADDYRTRWMEAIK